MRFSWEKPTAYWGWYEVFLENITWKTSDPCIIEFLCLPRWCTRNSIAFNKQYNKRSKTNYQWHYFFFIATHGYDHNV